MRYSGREMSALRLFAAVFCAALYRESEESVNDSESGSIPGSIFVFFRADAMLHLNGKSF